ncbi:murein L,D-transpeptidase [Devosia sp. J2-20]|uniref:Murein L,D-transpeptidase n=1 Tax=Devosia litorisediminis TaxID=2829817 RepID=A0A942E9H4_9HYPH|nr:MULTISPECIES: murein L,D-transpeptidase family protein [Devosia]MBS3850046.1 murein L,D-transpeptidase [Devosia litorisediminis]MCZ4347533.1 murein L,D-transpeptidase [Devosia neptuniae]WDQ99824.1 murein L,D-transpeptidase [Devosia sp. J2-20]
MTATVLRKICSAIILLWVVFGLAACGGFLPKSSSNRHNQPLQSSVVSALKSMGSSPGEAMMIRIFKQEQSLEVWKRTSAGQFKLFRTYEICAFSGDLGPKIKEGDRQSPEGFYTITPGLMNPKSNYYLAFNTGFPNKFDRVHGRTGSDLMVHGDCSSRGCYAMTDHGIAEIYALARESFKGGNSSFQLQIFPFKMTSTNLAKQAKSQHLNFWKDIKEGYDLFELNKQPPAWDVCERQYIFNASGGGALNAAGPCPAVTRSAALQAKLLADEKAVADELAATERRIAEEAALKERSEAVNGAVNGAVTNLFGGLGGLFGGEEVTPVMSGKTAPVPRPRLAR